MPKSIEDRIQDAKNQLVDYIKEMDKNEAFDNCDIETSREIHRLLTKLATLNEVKSDQQDLAK